MIQLRRFYNLGLIARNGPKCFADDSRNRCEIIIPDTVRAFSELDRDPDEKSDGGRQRVLASLMDGDVKTYNYLSRIPTAGVSLKSVLT